MPVHVSLCVAAPVLRCLPERSRILDVDEPTLRRTDANTKSHRARALRVCIRPNCVCDHSHICARAADRKLCNN